MWITRCECSIAVERQITEKDWDALVARMADLQSFDRAPEGWLQTTNTTRPLKSVPVCS